MLQQQTGQTGLKGLFNPIAPGNTEAFRELTGINESADQPPAAAAMVKDLLKSHEQVRARIDCLADIYTNHGTALAAADSQRRAVPPTFAQ